jgi:cell division protein FtsQ
MGVGGQVLDRAPIDPRIRARRIEVARTAGKRRLQRVFELGVVVLVAAGFLLALRSPLLDVERVQVAGAATTPSEAVVAAAAVDAGDQLVDVDVAAVGDRVAALPWVHTAHVSRSVDGTVSIRVTEREPVAVARTGAGRLLVDVDGRVLGTVRAHREQARGLVGVTAAEVTAGQGEWLPDHLSPALLLAQQLGTSVPGWVDEVRAAPELVATIRSGGEVRFGDTSRLEAKLVAFGTIVGQVDLDCLAVLDLRLPGNPVLTREDRCP